MENYLNESSDVLKPDNSSEQKWRNLTNMDKRFTSNSSHSDRSEDADLKVQIFFSSSSSNLFVSFFSPYFQFYAFFCI